MSDVTRVLSAIEQGDPGAAEQLLPLVYEEVRKLAAQRLARESPGQTLQATALVHEAYLRRSIPNDAKPWNGRRHFFGAAAEAMRRILVENWLAGKPCPNTAGNGCERNFRNRSWSHQLSQKTFWPSTKPCLNWLRQTPLPPSSSNCETSRGSLPIRRRKHWDCRPGQPIALGLTLGPGSRRN